MLGSTVIVNYYYCYIAYYTDLQIQSILNLSDINSKIHTVTMFSIADLQTMVYT
jgi:hypothetical protein